MKRCNGSRAVWAGVVALLAACGGGGGGAASSNAGNAGNSGGSGSTATGYLVDAPAYGVSYMTSSGLGGTTGADGSFSYRSGDTIDFSVLGVSLAQAAGHASIAVPASGIVTPFVIAGETPSSSSSAAPNSAAIAALLQTLANIAASSTTANTTAANLLVPSGTVASALQAAFASQTASGNGTLIETLGAGLASLVGAADAGYVVTPSAAVAVAYDFAQASASSQTAAGAADANTVWKLTGCSTATDGCTLYAVLMPNGTVSGLNVTKDGSFGGYWSAGTGGLVMHFQGGAGSADITLANGATGGQASIGFGSASGTATITELLSGQGAATVTNSGLWYANYTPTASSSGSATGQGLFVLGPDGSLAGITSGSASLSGTWSGSTGTLSSSDGQTCSLDLAALTGSCSSAGQTVGALVLSRTWLQPPAYGSGSGSGSSSNMTLSGTWQLACPQCQSGSTTGGTSSGTYSAVLTPAGNVTISFSTTASTGAGAGGLPSFSGSVGSSGAFSLTAGAGSDCASTLVFSLYGQISGSNLSFSVSRPLGALASGAAGACEAEYGSSGSVSAPTSYTVGGQASFGSSGNCVAISLADTTLAANNTTTIQVGPGCSTPVTFQFPNTIAGGDNWAVTIPANQPIAAYCSLSNASGTATANVTNVQVSCD